jgi:hypothetical protein
MGSAVSSPFRRAKAFLTVRDRHPFVSRLNGLSWGHFRFLNQFFFEFRADEPDFFARHRGGAGGELTRTYRVHVRGSFWRSLVEWPTCALRRPRTEVGYALMRCTIDQRVSLHLCKGSA